MTQVLFSGDGAFGTDIGAMLAASGLPMRPVEAGALVCEIATGTSPVAIVAAAYPSATRLVAVDDVAAESGVVLLPVVFEASYIRVGPWSDRRRGPCVSCYLTRRGQHEDRTIAAAYVTGTVRPPSGHMPHHIRLAAGLALTLIEDAESPATPGSVYAIRLAELAVTRHHVLGAHGCPRCGPPSVPAGTRVDWLAELADRRAVVAYG